MVRWLPLESNPEIMNKFLSDVGVPSSARVTDVYGLEPELLMMVPQPVYALLLLYPLNEKSEAFSAEQEAGIAASGQTVDPAVFYMRQSVGNACGTVALMHAVANCTDRVPLEDGAMKTFLASTLSMSPEERGQHLEVTEDIGATHALCAQEGQTEAPDKDEKLDTHFIAFVPVAGHIYELDGRKQRPINHGATSPDTFLADCAKVVQGFMDREPEDKRFAMLALAAED